ncbi:hypothetical protein V6Z11_A12G207400 [Gossypium hirsutum]
MLSSLPLSASSGENSGAGTCCPPSRRPPCRQIFPFFLGGLKKGRVGAGGTGFGTELISRALCTMRPAHEGATRDTGIGTLGFLLFLINLD